MNDTNTIPESLRGRMKKIEMLSEECTKLKALSESILWTLELNYLALEEDVEQCYISYEHVCDELSLIERKIRHEVAQLQRIQNLLKKTIENVDMYDKVVFIEAVQKHE